LSLAAQRIIITANSSVRLPPWPERTTRKIDLDSSNQSGVQKVKPDKPTASGASLSSIPQVTICFGAVAGLLEGVGLLPGNTMPKPIA
jgi:hypothetical protein